MNLGKNKLAQALGVLVRSVPHQGGNANGIDPAVGMSLGEAFQRDTNASVISGVRLGLKFAIALFPVFAILDYFRVPAFALEIVLGIRAVSWVVIIILWLLGRTQQASERPILYGLVCTYLTGLSIALMTLMFEPSTNPYYAGVNLVLIGQIIVPWGLMPTAVVSGGLWLTYLISHIVLGLVNVYDKVALSSFITNNFFMASTALMATGVNWYAHNLRFEAFRARFQQNRAYNELHLANEQLGRQHQAVNAQRQQLAEAKTRLEEKSSELEKAMKTLAEQYRYKSQFLDNMNHELRTPLTCIITPLEALLGGNVQGELKQILKGMQGSANQLLDQINDLLDVSKYQNKEVPLHREPTDVAARVREILDSWRFNARQKQLTLELDAPADLPEVWVDRRELGKVIRNLVSNAVKFTPAGGTIIVRLREVDDMFELAVVDTGPGIPEEALPKLFQPFFQVDGSQTRAHEGTGLGLALVDMIIRRHGGYPGISSKVGVGTTVSVRLPLASLEGLESPEAPGMVDALPSLEQSRPVNLEPWEQFLGHLPENMTDIPAEQLTSPIFTLEDALPGFNGKPTVMVVEDNLPLNELLVRLLSPSYEVISAVDGMDALEKIQASPPDLIISDIMMPRMTGLQLLEAVRRERIWERLPFILLTAKADGQDRVQGLWSGANDYLTKPFLNQELLARVGNLLRIRSFETYLSQRTEALEGNFDRFFVNTVKTLVAAIDAKDYYTGGHSERVAFFSMVLAEPYNLSQPERDKLELGALLHDVGKIGVPDRVLNKPGDLTPEEVLIIREHPVYSGRILDKAPELAELRGGAVYHHERWDGKGYPHGLKGKDIPWMARIISMADCWDAMVSDRVYRPGMDPEVAVSKIRKMTGTQIDPEVVEALLQVYPRLAPPDYLRPLKARKAPTENHDPRVGNIDQTPGGS